jgi:hypothetical protein
MIVRSRRPRTVPHGVTGGSTPLVGAGLTVRAVDRLELEPFLAVTDPAMAYSRRFAPEQSMVVWLTERTRQDTSRVSTTELWSSAWTRGLALARDSVAERAMRLARCLPHATPLPSTALRCRRVSKLSGEDGLTAHIESNNPFALRAALSEPHGCHLEALRDTLSERAWVLVAGGEQIDLVPCAGHRWCAHPDGEHSRRGRGGDGARPAACPGRRPAVTRWVVVALLLGLVGLALVGIRSARPGEGPRDEYLTYELSAGRTVEVGIPAGVPRVLLTSWLVVRPEAIHDAARQYPYTLESI